MHEYVAGVIDAVGHVTIRETQGSRLPQVTVSSADLQLCRQLSQLTGVKVVSVHRDYGRVGCSTHCTEPHLHVKSSTYRWQLVGARARIVLEEVLPYLRVKAEEVQAVLDETAGAGQKTPTLEKMRELGWSA